jgi:hypothetical protein
LTAARTRRSRVSALVAIANFIAAREPASPPSSRPMRLAAYGRNATSTELQQQGDALDAAAAQSQSQVQAQAEAMGRSLFAAQVNDFSITA